MIKKRKFGDRRDGRKLRTLLPFNRVSPYIMKNRIGSQNFIRGSIDLTEIEKYIKQKRADGLKGFGILHVILATYVRTVTKYPGINRFIGGQKIYARNNIEIVMTIKKELSLNAPETAIKLTPSPRATAKEVYEEFSKLVEKNRSLDNVSNFDKTARFLNYIPGLVLKFTVFFLNFLDYFGLLPKFLTDVSPFHGSFLITSMGSLGIPPIYHHLYDFGNIPIFCSYGAKRTEYVVQKDGSVAEKKYIDYTFVTDERICDGHYFASALKMMHDIFKNPSILDSPPKIIRDDIL